MLKASGRKGDRPVLVAGLTDGNIERLKNDLPISIRTEDYGLPFKADLVFVWGKTEYDIALKLTGDETIQMAADDKLNSTYAITSAHPRVLILTVGLPRSGKTTWARTQAKPIVNPDSIRLSLHGQRFVPEAEEFVWAIAKVMVRSPFLAGHDIVILDATGITVKRRERWISKEWATYYKVIDTAAHVCRERAQAAKDEYIIPIINRQEMEYEPLADGEKTCVWP